MWEVQRAVAHLSVVRCALGAWAGSSRKQAARTWQGGGGWSLGALLLELQWIECSDRGGQGGSKGRVREGSYGWKGKGGGKCVM